MEGALDCWGLDEDGQAQVPDQIYTDNNIASVSSGSFHYCAVNTIQELKCWGSNERIKTPEE